MAEESRMEVLRQSPRSYVVFCFVLFFNLILFFHFTVTGVCVVLFFGPACVFAGLCRTRGSLSVSGLCCLMADGRC